MEKANGRYNPTASCDPTILENRCLFCHFLHPAHFTAKQREAALDAVKMSDPGNEPGVGWAGSVGG
jgi:hypothetical protein